ncbi:hypothetical protein POM88_006193 [Heracleum sosnowskyi]|uniref:Glucosyltransferase n=1 Tax=Heracleum sosnowskyi TaxID=360622 RepID=A0AAD8MZU0_9APIA|nr:hypothetical protein POM88_006193 [Heracleum sosnowskyi]
MIQKPRPVQCLVFPYTMQGHINLMHQFSKTIVSRGIKVTLVTTKFLFKSFQQLSGTSMPVETISDDFDEAVLDVMVNQFLDIDKVDWVLCNTFYKLEEEVIDWMSKQLRLRAIRPTIPRKYLNNQKTAEDDTYNGL